METHDSTIEMPTEVPLVLREINDRLEAIWNDYRGNVDALSEKINNFIFTSLYVVINKVYNENAAPNTKPRAKKTVNDKSRKNRNARKKYSYARCQELFHECPKKLADVIVNNDRAYLEPSRQPPNAIEVKRLYGGLRGKTDLLNTPIPGNKASELSLIEYFSPVTAEDVGERISKIRKKAAAGPDGLQRVFHLEGK
jgi:hypothetical protein